MRDYSHKQTKITTQACQTMTYFVVIYASSCSLHVQYLLTIHIQNLDGVLQDLVEDVTDLNKELQAKKFENQTLRGQLMKKEIELTKMVSCKAIYDHLISSILYMVTLNW